MIFSIGGASSLQPSRHFLRFATPSHTLRSIIAASKPADHVPTQ